jgi:hypothetical protein
MVSLRPVASENLSVLPGAGANLYPDPFHLFQCNVYTEKDPLSGKLLFVEKSLTGKMRQKAAITGWGNKERPEQESRMPTLRKDARVESGDVEKPKSVETNHDTRRAPIIREETSLSAREDAPVVRVVRDDFGSFLHNQAPEGWVERKTKRAESADAERRPRYSDSDTRPPRTGGDRPYRERTDRKPREASTDTRPPRTDGDSPYRERKDYKPREGSSDTTRPPRTGSDRPYRERTDRKPREGSSDTSRPPRTDGDRPYRERKDYKPREGSSDTTRPPRTDGDRPYRERKDYKPREGSSDTSRPPRTDGDRPYRERTDRKPREASADTRPPRTDGNRPYRERTDRKPREASADTRPPRTDGDRPYRERKDYKPREGSADSRPPRTGSDRPYRERTDRKPREGSSDTSRPPRTGGNKPSQAGYKRDSGGKPGYPKAGSRDQGRRDYRAGTSRKDSRPAGKDTSSGDSGNSNSGERG